MCSLSDCAFALQSAGGEWSETCKEEAQPVLPPFLLSHLIMWNNFSRCPALISLCGNSSLVPNCGARRTQPEHTAERKGNNWSLPCLTHRFLLTFIVIMSFTEGDCVISFRHFMSAAPFLEPSHYPAPSLYLLLSFLYCRQFTTWFLPSYTICIKWVVDAKTRTCQEKRRHQVKILSHFEFHFGITTLRMIHTLVSKCPITSVHSSTDCSGKSDVALISLSLPAFWLFVAPLHRFRGLDASQQVQPGRQ